MSGAKGFIQTATVPETVEAVFENTNQVTPTQQVPAQQPVPTAVPTTAPAQQQTQPVEQPSPQGTQQQQPVQQPVQQSPQSQAVPTSAPSYTMDQLAVAATQLMDAGKREELVQLLASFGVQALTALPKEQYGAFATKLRELGAKL
ncbi:hypothetical protein [Bacillus smithii]|uniref:hypothetical protein n=1 Tax=Bacillus smithii TaxID=1479 RepID=UPI002E22DE08|nr:hypothetical protein [Bacillus smithii]MED1456625.1 hypothetical protein [Bacillus smithii]